MIVEDLASGEEELISDEYAVRLIKGENPVRVWLEYRKLTQAKLANAVGISTPYLSQIEQEIRQPSIKTLAKIAKKLGVSVGDLI